MKSQTVNVYETEDIRNFYVELPNILERVPSKVIGLSENGSKKVFTRQRLRDYLIKKLEDPSSLTSEVTKQESVLSSKDQMEELSTMKIPEDYLDIPVDMRKYQKLLTILDENLPKCVNRLKLHPLRSIECAWTCAQTCV